MTADVQLQETAPVQDVKSEEKQEKVEIDLQEKTTDDNDTAEDEPLVKKDEEPVPKKTVHKEDYEEGMIYLYQANRTPVLPSIDPACLKLETWLRLAEVKYENVEHGMKFKSKEGQLPFIELDGEEYSHMPSIVNVLNGNLDGNLTAQQKCVTSFAVAMLENHFSWVLKAWRSKNSEEMLKAYKIDLQKITGKTWPNILLKFVYKRQVKKIAQAVVAHGIGVHTPEEIESFGQDDLQVLSDLLGEQDYFFGESPSSLDVVAFAHLAQLVYMDSEIKCGLKEWLSEKCTNLVALCDRIKEKAFPDWDELLAPKIVEPEPEDKSEEKVEKEEKEKVEEKEEKKSDAKKEEKESDAKKEEKESDAKKEEKEKVDEKDENEEVSEKEKVAKKEKLDKKSKKESKDKEKKEKEDKKKKEKEDKKKEKEEKKKEEENKKKKEKDAKKDGDKNKDEENTGEKEGEKEVDNKDQETKETTKQDEENKEDPTNEEEKKDEEKPVEVTNNADESILSQENTQL